jgi:spore coat protein SA
MTLQGIRVAFIAPEGLEIPPLRGGSVQIYLSQLLQALQSSEPQIQSVLFCKNSSQQETDTFQIVRIHATNQNLYRKEVLRKLKSIQSDVIQVDNRPSWITDIHKTCPKKPIVLNLHSTTFIGKATLTPALRREIWKKTSGIVANSHALANVLIKRFGAPKTKVHVIHPGVNLEAFPSRHHPQGEIKRQTIRNQYNCDHQFVFLYAGRVIRQKGVHTILQAFRQVHRHYPNARLFIIGKTPSWEAKYRSWIQTLAKGLPVTIRSYLPHDQLVDYYLGADAFLCPSQLFEAFGLVNVEAMATGLPVIGSRQGGIAEIVNETCGTLVNNYRSTSAWKQAMIQALHNPDRWRNTLSIQARNHVETHFTWKQTAMEFTKLYQVLHTSTHSIQ